MFSKKYKLKQLKSSKKLTYVFFWGIINVKSIKMVRGENRDMATISVIMGIYNCRDFKMLEKSIESIRNQSFTDWEFIICNDGSSDNTLSELEKYPKKDSRIKVISYEQNMGLAYALNECIKYATGKYIARQDDDDISLKNRFEKQVEFLENNPKYSFVGTTARVFDSNGIWGRLSVEEKPGKKSFYWNSPFIHPTTLFRREAIEEVGGYKVTKITRRCEDYDMFMSLYSMGHIGYNIQEVLYHYQFINGNEGNGKDHPFKYRIDEMRIRWTGFKKMNVLSIFSLPYVVKPIIISLIPQFVFKKIIRKRFSIKKSHRWKK